MNQQDKQTQQQNKKGVFMDLETVIEVRDSLAGYAMLALFNIYSIFNRNWNCK